MFENLPIIPLRGLVVFPLQTALFDISRAGSLLALEQAMDEQKRVFLAAQRDTSVENPHIEDLYSVGTVARVRQIMRMPDGALRLLVSGERRALLVELEEHGNFAMAHIAPMAICRLEDERVRRAHARVLRGLVRDLNRQTDALTSEALNMIVGEKNAVVMGDIAAAHVLGAFEDKQELLEAFWLKFSEIVQIKDQSTAAIVASYDLVVITAAHTNFDYDMIQKNAQAIFDTRNAMQSIAVRENIEVL